MSAKVIYFQVFGHTSEGKCPLTMGSLAATMHNDSFGENSHWTKTPPSGSDEVSSYRT